MSISHFLKQIFGERRVKKNSSTNNPFITDSSINREKIYNISRAIFRESIEDVGKADNKIRIYFILINIVTIVYVNVFVDFFVAIFKNNVIEINVYKFLLLLAGIIAFILITIIFYSTLQGLKQINLDGHPTRNRFNEMLVKREKEFWHNMYSHYYVNSYNNRDKLNKKRQKIKQIEKNLSILFLISLIAIIIIVVEQITQLKSFKILF